MSRLPLGDPLRAAQIAWDAAKPRLQPIATTQNDARPPQASAPPPQTYEAWHAEHAERAHTTTIFLSVEKWAPLGLVAKGKADWYCDRGLGARDGEGASSSTTTRRSSTTTAALHLLATQRMRRLRDTAFDAVYSVRARVPTTRPPAEDAACFLDAFQDQDAAPRFDAWRSSSTRRTPALCLRRRRAGLSSRSRALGRRSGRRRRTSSR